MATARVRKSITGAPKYYIKNFGCQANIADSNLMASILDSYGFLAIPLQDSYKNEHEEIKYACSKADLLIINTCSVRQKSEDKVYGLGKMFKELYEETGNKPYVIMAGCMVGSVRGDRKRYDFSELKKKTRWYDEYIAPNEIDTLPSIIKKAGLVSPEASTKIDISKFIPNSGEKDHAFVNISYGCDNFCTYCAVPYAREKEISRPLDEIINEVEKLGVRGITKITLCGQNVNSWGLSFEEKFKIRTGSDQKIPFADLLRKVHELPCVEKIDFLSSNPFDFTQDLIDALKMPKISNYIHIAVQSGNNEVLQSMNRRHSIEDFINLIEKIHEVRPDMEIGTDLIVGFPGETEEQFLDTVDLVKKIKFSVAFIAMYSPRKGTVASEKMIDNVSYREKQRRHSLLTKAFNENRPEK